MQAIRDLFQQGIDTHLHLGAQVYIWRDGEVIIDEAIGEKAIGKPLNSTDIMLWLSMGKPLTAMLIAKLWERGELDLDLPVAHYLPEFGANGKDDIITQHILMHTAGFRFIVNIEVKPVEEAWAAICKMPKDSGWITGQDAGYHPATSWQVLGELVKKITGLPFNDALSQHVLHPLGMVDCYCGHDQIDPDRFVPSYGTGNNKTPDQFKSLDKFNSPSYVALVRPGGNMRGPVRELGKFYRMLLWDGINDAGEEIFDEDTVKLFTKRQRVGKHDHTFQTIMDWGLGFIVARENDPTQNYAYNFGPYCSPNTFGHGGSQSSNAFCDPENKLIVAWATNGHPGEPVHQKRNRAINTGIYEALGIT